MEHEHTIYGLMRRRQEMSNRIEATQNALRQLVIDLDHIDATIRLFDPNVDLETIKPRPLPPKHQAFKGEVSRIVLTALRTSKEPMTTKALALKVMGERGLDTGDTGLVQLMGRRVHACLAHYRRKGLATALQGDGDLQVWKLV